MDFLVSTIVSLLSESEEPSKGREKFLQYSCYIDKDVKYLHTGLKNRLQVSCNFKKGYPIMNNL